jgi:hypothetical protein
MRTLDGVYVENAEGLIAFHPVAPLNDKEIARSERCLAISVSFSHIF